MPPIQVDPNDVLQVALARAAQTYSELLAEVAKLTAYARELEKRLAEREPDPTPQ